MQKNNKNHLFKALRKKHPFFIYESFNISQNQSFIKITFSFRLSGDISFHPSITIPKSANTFVKPDDETLENLAFHIGMVELISYWKAACPPRVIIKPAQLSGSQVDWWKKLWYKGLGEFFYTNGIDTSPEDFLHVTCESSGHIKSFRFEPDSGVLVPVGGGKDSVVTLELLKRAGLSVIPFILNPREASLGTAGIAGFSEQEIFTMKRTIDPALTGLNDQGYLNGHTPFSALLAFVTLLAARISGAGHIALSNESSASEATIPGSDINHQYSKSYEFENDFRTYISTHVCPDINYFSFLRPLNELQIAQIFSAFPQHFDTFKSCNAGSKTNSWCGKCPKCLFVRIILAPFITRERLIAIFGNEILNDSELIPMLNELTGMTDEKPFECVGTIDEVNAALSRLIVDKDTGSLPLLLDYYKKTGRVGEGAFREHLNQFDRRNNLPAIFEEVLKQSIQ